MQACIVYSDLVVIVSLTKWQFYLVRTTVGINISNRYGFKQKKHEQEYINTTVKLNTCMYPV